MFSHFDLYEGQNPRPKHELYSSSLTFCHCFIFDALYDPPYSASYGSCYVICHSILTISKWGLLNDYFYSNSQSKLQDAVSK